MDQTHQDFIIEIDDLVEQILADLEALRAQLNDGAARRRLLADLFRRTHSLKGSAAAISLDQASRIAHELEHRIAAVNSGKAALNGAVLDVIEDAVNLLVESLAPNVSRELEAAIDTSIKTLWEMSDGHPHPAAANCELLIASLPSDIRQALTDNQKLHLGQALVEQKGLFIVSSAFDLADFDQQVYRLKARLEEIGEVVSTHPTMNPAQPDRIEFRLLFLNEKGRPQITSEFDGLKITPVTSESAGKEADIEDRREDHAQSSALSVRIALDRIEMLQRLGNDLARTASEALAMGVKNASDEQSRSILQKSAERVREGFREIDEQIAGLLRVPLGGILKRAERAGRAAARLTGKDILFETTGADLLIDKYLSELIASPLVHLVRNAVDHGIENSSERGRLGKSQQGTIRIEALREADQIIIRVVDDGRGIDPELVSVAAAKIGLIEAGAVLHMEACVQLLFKPEFSTAGSVSTTSGRGVGLDVVETAVQRIGGRVHVVSDPGFGSTFEISLRC